MANRYQFTTTLEGYVNVYEDSGKFNNRSFAYQLPSDLLETVEADRTELLEWAKSKAQGRVQIAMTLGMTLVYVSTPMEKVMVPAR